MNLEIPPDTLFYEPDGIHRVTVQFPDADSAIAFYEWFKQRLIDSGAKPEMDEVAKYAYLAANSKQS